MRVPGKRPGELHHGRGAQRLGRRGDALSEAGEALAFATTLAREAGELLLRYEPERGALETHAKSTPTDLVSAADRASEALIRERIELEYPADAILGEEGADRDGSSGRTWVVDPLDGTTNFLFGVPSWAVSIACEDADGPLVGCIVDPKRNECFTAERGGGAQLNGVPMAVSPRADVSRALVATGFNYDAKLRRTQAEQLARLIGSVRDVRRFGAASLDLAWVACGRFDGFYEAGLGRWDWAAGALLVREAGGAVAHVPSPHGGEQLLATNGALHAELERLVTS
ncbi:MAG: inositol monophosphatase family protein [Gaiellaceae bacterium]